MIEYLLAGMSFKLMAKLLNPVRFERRHLVNRFDYCIQLRAQVVVTSTDRLLLPLASVICSWMISSGHCLIFFPLSFPTDEST